MSLRIIGRLLRGVRAGDRGLVCNGQALQAAPETIRLHSGSFVAGGLMPPRCAGRGVGENTSPQLGWTDLPTGAAELVLIMQDPDAPLPRPVVHLIAYGIDPNRTSFAEGALSSQANGMRLGQGTFGKPGYQGPRPVPGHGRHRYIFQLIALKASLGFEAPPKLDAVVAALGTNVLAWGQLIGLFER
jgi:Raf kinase inhibitor-like YbhB/YbcL family protein